MLYGVNVTDAGIFALIVHGIQTFLVVLLGVYGCLLYTSRFIGEVVVPPSTTKSPPVDASLTMASLTINP